jgi:hypothetical protein
MIFACLNETTVFNCYKTEENCLNFFLAKYEYDCTLNNWNCKKNMSKAITFNSFNQPHKH